LALALDFVYYIKYVDKYKIRAGPILILEEHQWLRPCPDG